MKPEVSIVIPAYNESERLGAPLRTILEFISTAGMNVELIVVDDGSSDDTVTVAERAFATMPDIQANVIR